MKEHKICPLKDYICQEEKCAWWIKSEKCCAIVAWHKPFVIGMDLSHSEVQNETQISM